MEWFREALELYRRAVANIPDDLDTGGRGALLDAYAFAAGAIEQNELAERTFRDARAAYLDAGQPAKATEMLVGVLHIWRRELRSAGDRSALAASLFEELERLPASSLWGGQKLPGWLFREAVRIHLDAMAIDTARSSIETMRENATAHGDVWDTVEANELTAIVAVLWEGCQGL